MTHPITPPPELVHQWADMLASGSGQAVFAMAARWGADKELEACLRYAGDNGLSLTRMRAARRPKLPSLKEQALAALQEAAHMADDIPPQGICSDQIDTIRRALEALDD